MEIPSLFPDSGSNLPIRALANLAPREWDVLLEVSKDLSNIEIAMRLHLAEKSVENYRTRIGSKLGYEGPRLLARFARQHQAELRQWYEIMLGKVPPPIISYIQTLFGCLFPIFEVQTPTFLRGLSPIATKSETILLASEND